MDQTLCNGLKIWALKITGEAPPVIDEWCNDSYGDYPYSIEADYHQLSRVEQAERIKEILLVYKFLVIRLYERTPQEFFPNIYYVTADKEAAAHFKLVWG